MPRTPTVERTRAGLQYVLPGAERRIPPKPMTYPRDGAQLVIPGAERISVRELAARLMAAPIRLRARQRSLAGAALFGTPCKPQRVMDSSPAPAVDAAPDRSR